ncbi:unnamed protein product [Hyaloperonospora brassicae]|uniref:PiggyBac transposable element-derived protein domain-containing protein n=1 Tax=Hyaloperonospora brassicae TaxID=162125 RepID=A0AAV0TB93_HYABA|nr:unnamed protein product [Hyaloperonospora brassicae]
MELSRDDCDVCHRVTQELLHEALRDCVELGIAATRDANRAQFDKKRWKKLETAAHVSVYADRRADSAWLPMMRRPEWEGPVAVTAVGRMECSLDDVLFAVMTPNAAMLKLRAFLMDHRLEKNCQLVPIETPTQDAPFRFLAATRFVNTHNWPFTMFKSPREMILAIATGYTTSASGKPCAYELAQSVELPCTGARDRLMSRSRVLQARLFWEQPDGSIAVYCKLVVDARNCLSDAVKQTTLCQSVLRFWKFVPRSLETKKLWWCVKNKRRLIHELRTNAQAQGAETFATCQVKSLRSHCSKAGAAPRCEFCDKELCDDPKCRQSCQLKMILSSNTGILEQMLTLCLRCAVFVRNQNAADIARAQLVEMDQTSYGSGASFTKVAPAWNEDDSSLASRASTEST